MLSFILLTSIYVFNVIICLLVCLDLEWLLDFFSYLNIRTGTTFLSIVCQKTCSIPRAGIT